MYRNRLKWRWFLLLWRRTCAVSYCFTTAVGSTVQTLYRQILMKTVSSVSLVLCSLYTCKTESAAYDICKLWYSAPHVWPCCMSCDATLIPKRKQQGVMGNTSIKIANNFILFWERCCKEKKNPFCLSNNPWKKQKSDKAFPQEALEQRVDNYSFLVYGHP